MKRLSWMWCLLLLSLTAAGQDVANDTTSLSARLDTLIKRSLPPGGSVGISVYDLTANTPLYIYGGDKLSRPASTMKLLTAITSLVQPAADEPFRTEVWYHGTIARDTLHGDLYVVGGFDPEFGDAALDSLVDAVARLPFSVITGQVKGDVSMKDSLYWGSGWMWDDTPAAFQPYLSPLMLNKGKVDVTAVPTRRDSAATVGLVPASTYYTVTNETKSRTPAAGRFRVSRNWLQHGNSLLVSGNVDRKLTGSVNIYSSQHFFMHTFLERLRAKGIDNGINNGQMHYGFGTLPADTLSTLVVRYETPMQDVLDRMMKESDNLNAEAMLCRLGAQVTGKKHITAEAGLDAIRTLITQLGDNPKHYRLADGCGLSQYNYITPDLLVSFLRLAYSQTDVFRKLYKSLPVSGIDGSLKYRMKNAPLYRNVHAKTGTVTGICCLAGYLQAANGHEIAFAVMNQNQLSATAARRFQDSVCEEIAR
ncbi:MAG: D-alanyl-D-alanine carboxypeptidase/D-alanyl-D-alanine-endopeptidase [Prevotellaceae bacterium]|jgi:D-alanyl-D-alanine carboxypeptidase/D-alanyl-D-alanine-endopeptidase (penicillin-binding protein 4)|nr:D-alanyl-D-alanine carboxypeptidase/D-alanyl-D-alanine-endopeptidase [Prevotellaceae bacterium]